MTRIKICGITTLADARTSLEAGADMVGFNFYPKSKRYISPEKCREIVNNLKCRNSVPSRTGVPRQLFVGVFVNSPIEEIESIMATCGLHLAQLHGDEPPEILAQLGERAFKALRVNHEEQARQAIAELPLRAAPPAFLIDAQVKGEYGGTGQTADWGLVCKLARSAPILLAGGLTPENVGAAVCQVKPWGVDVASGVESTPGQKDAIKIRTFIQNVRQADQESDPIQIEIARKEDLVEILALQKLAYQSEAALNQDYNIPPLTQTHAGIVREFHQKVFLKAVKKGEIVGSVRADQENGTCQIGRLIVNPQEQNQGIGSELLLAIEAQFGKANCFELFTSQRSTRNLYLYQKYGYQITRQELLNERVNLIYLQKSGKPK
jgi:phosphoribosylanthranilate isomerase